MLINYSLIFTALVLLAGLAVDFGMMERDQILLQNSANAALAASTVTLQRTGSSTTATSAGKAAAAANGFTDGSNGATVAITITPLASSYSSTLLATVTQSITPAFLGILGMGKISMKAQSSQKEGVPVNLSSAYNVISIYTDGHSIPSNGGFGGNGYAFSANALGQVRESNGLGAILSWRGQIFSLAAGNSANGVSQATVQLPHAIPYSQLLILASTAWGYSSTITGTFVVTYTDSSTATSSFSMSDWCSPQNYAGESIVSKQAYRDWGTGQDYTCPNYIYGYSINLDNSKNLSTLKLPTVSNVVLLAMNVMP
jgi:hypothetical protein